MNNCPCLNSFDKLTIRYKQNIINKFINDIIVNKNMKKNKINQIKKPIVDVLKKHRIRKAGIFGSYARGEEKKNSDIDILIKPPKNIGFGFVGIQFELEDKLKKKVDLLSYGAIHPLLKKIILREEVRII